MFGVSAAISSGKNIDIPASENLVLADFLVANGIVSGAVKATIPAGVIVGGTLKGGFALVVGDISAYSKVEVVVDGEIQGRGGNANEVGNGGIQSDLPITLTINGQIRAGGGGGGNGGAGGVGGAGGAGNDVTGAWSGDQYIAGETFWNKDPTHNQIMWADVELSGSGTNDPNIYHLTVGDGYIYNRLGYKGWDHIFGIQRATGLAAGTPGVGGAGGGNGIGGAGIGYNNSNINPVAPTPVGGGTAGTNRAGNGGNGGAGGVGGAGGSWDTAGANGADGLNGATGKTGYSYTIMDGSAPANGAGGGAGTNATQGKAAGVAISVPAESVIR